MSAQAVVERMKMYIVIIKDDSACPAMCTGDGEPGTSTTRDKILDMVFSNKDVGQRQR